MSRLRFYLAAAVLYCVLVLGEGKTTQKPVLMAIPTDNSAKPETPEPIASTEVDTDATSSGTDTTTGNAITSTEAPPTTTTVTTTTSTTPATTAAPKPAPGPLPAPDQGTWSYTEGNLTCIVVQFAAQLNVTYTKTVNSTTSLVYALLNVPAKANVTGGSCNVTRQWLTVSWTADNTTLTDLSVANNLTLVFEANTTSKKYSLKSLNVSLVPAVFVNATSPGPVEISHGAEWPVPVGNSYRCAAPTQLNMTAESASVVAALTLSRLQEEAFRTAKGEGFSAARSCGGGDVPDAVPIAVGCALGGLVVVVLIAYLVGRRRSAARGYLSM